MSINMVFRLQGDMLRITVKRLLFTGSEWGGINSVQMVRDGESQEQAERASGGHWKGRGCAEQGEALVTFAALSVQGNFFPPKKLSVH